MQLMLAGSHKLVGNGKDAKIKLGIFSTECKSVNWMHKNKILISIYICIIHWILVVVEVR